MARRDLSAALELGKQCDLLQGVQWTLAGGVEPLLRGIELERNVYALSLAVPGVIALANLRKVGVCVLFLEALTVKGSRPKANVGFQIAAAGAEPDDCGVGAER